MVESKIHMRNAVEEGKTLCGRSISKTTKVVANPHGVQEITCKNCKAMIDDIDLGRFFI